MRVLNPPTASKERCILNDVYLHPPRPQACEEPPCSCPSKVQQSPCAFDVTGHRSNTLDNQCGATIADISAGGSLPLCKCAEKAKTARDSLVVGKSKTVFNIIKS